MTLTERNVRYAFERGQDDYRAGFDIADCPYQGTSETAICEAAAWMEGWHHEDAEARRERVH